MKRPPQSSPPLEPTLTPPSALPRSILLDPLPGEQVLLPQVGGTPLPDSSVLRRAVEALAEMVRNSPGIVREGFPGDVELGYHFSLRIHGEKPHTYGGTLQLHALLSADGIDTAPSEFEASMLRILRPLNLRVLALANRLSAATRVTPANVTTLLAVR